MTIAYCRDDPVSSRWVGLDRLLTEYEIDYNFYQHETRISTLEANYTLTVSIGTITQPSPSTMRVTKTDATYYDIELPLGEFNDQGDWAVSTSYLKNDTFNAPNGGLYRVKYPHISDDTEFDPNDNDGAGHDYYAPMIPPRGNTIAAGGAVGMYYRKNSVTDYVANWSYIQASEVVFSASTGSSLISTNLADVVEELETLIATSIAAIVVAAVDVTFTPPTGSALVSTNVSDALVELEGLIPTGTGAPDTADYLVKTANGSLSAERVVTDTPGVTWDWATAGQAKAVLAVTFTIAASDESTALTTGTAKVTFRMPHAMTLTAVRASLSTAQTSGSVVTVDVNEAGTTILSTKLTFDNTEKTTTTAATPAVISDTALADDAEITIDIDQVGDGTAKGLKVTLIGTRP